jgi:quercetin dioxygenase-like cupin family protein
MPEFRIDFNLQDWKVPAPCARFKARGCGDRQMRLAEFTPEFTEPDWCVKGHIGYVLEGVMQLDSHGEVETFRAGDGFHIPAGHDSGHKVRALTNPVRLLLIEELHA